MANHLFSNFIRQICLVAKIAWRLGISVYLTGNNSKGSVKSRPPNVKVHHVSNLGMVAPSHYFTNSINNLSV